MTVVSSRDDDRVKTAKPGENVTVKIPCSDSDVMKGFVICSAVAPCHAATLFIAQIALVELTEQASTQRSCGGRPLVFIVR